MEPTPAIAAPLLQVGILMGIVLVGNAIAIRHLPVDSVPTVLRARIAMCNRARPWLFSAAAAIAGTGLFLILS